MNKTTDVLVIGAGLAGLTAALAAVEAGCQVSILCAGMGNLSISGGCVDVLGYDINGERLASPWDGMEQLPANHPYALLGRDYLQETFKKFIDVLAAQGWPMKMAKEDGEPVNICLPTIMGTLKPTYLIPDGVNIEALKVAQKILVIGIQGFRDCKPGLVVDQLKRYPAWSEKEYGTLVLPPPFREKGRSLNALDIARACDRKEGREWFLGAIKGKGLNYDIAFLPPILGARITSSIREEAAEILGCPCIELQCIPPGVGGLRLREALVNKLLESNVEFFENASVINVSVQNGTCTEVGVNASGREVKHAAKAIVVATGGIISGGIVLGEGNAREAVFGLSLPVPPNVDDWTEPEIFGQHFLTSLGVTVDAEMRPVEKSDDQKLENVFFAGRTIGGYDYATEKSGHGVAIATGWKAGEMAAQTAGCSAAVGKGGAV